MNRVVDLAQAYQQNKVKKTLIGIENFINVCVQDNKPEIIKAISKMKNFEASYIVESFAFQMISGMFIEKTQDELLKMIAGGSIFKVKDDLLAAIYNDTEIQEVIEEKNLVSSSF
ncbi:hypothetical protein [Bacillus infantis]|uniref:hypothetical protein n=1 Tax=Bacillus infantis TaxID=324767 RepID=UPI003CEC98C5